MFSLFLSRRNNRLSSRQYRDKYLGPAPRSTRNDLRIGAWCFDGGQPEVNLRFTRQYRLLLAPPRALPRVPWGTTRARAPHNSHNKSPRTTDARSTYKGITDQKEDRKGRLQKEKERKRERMTERGGGGGGGGKGSQQWVDPDHETTVVAKGVTVASQAARSAGPGESMSWTLRGNHPRREIDESRGRSTPRIVTSPRSRIRSIRGFPKSFAPHVLRALPFSAILRSRAVYPFLSLFFFFFQVVSALHIECIKFYGYIDSWVTQRNLFALIRGWTDLEYIHTYIPSGVPTLQSITVNDERGLFRSHVSNILSH